MQILNECEVFFLKINWQLKYLQSNEMITFFWSISLSRPMDDAEQKNILQHKNTNTNSVETGSLAFHISNRYILHVHKGVKQHLPQY